MTDDELREDIKNSKELVDNRTETEKSLYRENQAKNRQARADLYQYERYKAVLGEDAPASFISFRALKRADGDNWQNLQKLYRNKNYYEKLLKNLSKDGILKSGALNSHSSEGIKHSEQYYKAVRKMKYDYKTIAKNIGFSEKDVLAIKEHIFINKHDFGDGDIGMLDPDYDMSVARQRLMTEPDKIKNSDLVLLNHEKLELNLEKKGYTQVQTHIISSKKYNYNEALFLVVYQTEIPKVQCIC